MDEDQIIKLLAATERISGSVFLIANALCVIAAMSMFALIDLAVMAVK